MKKFAATILAILYLVTSTGATVHMHYCMGKLKSAGLWHSKGKKDACATCGMAKKKGCCEDKHTVIKIDKQYDAHSQTVSLSKLLIEPTLHNKIDFDFAYTPNPTFNFPLPNSPPGINKLPLYVANCVYRI